MSKPIGQFAKQTPDALAQTRAHARSFAIAIQERVTEHKNERRVGQDENAKGNPGANQQPPQR